MKATTKTLVWCLEISITTCKSRDASGMRERKPQYDKTEKRAMIVKMMAPASDKFNQRGDTQAKAKLTPILRDPIIDTNSATLQQMV